MGARHTVHTVQAPQQARSGSSSHSPLSLHGGGATAATVASLAAATAASHPERAVTVSAAVLRGGTEHSPEDELLDELELQDVDRDSVTFAAIYGACPTHGPYAAAVLTSLGLPLFPRTGLCRQQNTGGAASRRRGWLREQDRHCAPGAADDIVPGADLKRWRRRCLHISPLFKKKKTGKK